MAREDQPRTAATRVFDSPRSRIRLWLPNIDTENAENHAMDAQDLERLLALSRKKLLELLEAIAASGSAEAILGWRPGPGRAHIAWQMMHVAATEDRHLNVRMKNGEAADAELVRRFAGGSVPDDEIPSVEAIRRYLTERREALATHLRTLSAADLLTKPHPEAMWIYREWFEILAWHEGHHHGQAHITFNLWRASSGSALARVGH